MKIANIILIDNYDSFTYNLVDQFRSLGFPVTIYRNHFPYEQIEKAITKLHYPIMVLSPGPGIPEEAGSMPKLIKRLKGKIPILGICLGHQALVEAYGGKVGGAEEIVHGKASKIYLESHPVFAGLTNPFTIARYHSLVATKIPESLKVIASFRTLVMAVANDQDKVIGYQFHPESILTTQGEKLLRNTMNWILE